MTIHGAGFDSLHALIDAFVGARVTSSRMTAAAPYTAHEACKTGCKRGRRRFVEPLSPSSEQHSGAMRRPHHFAVRAQQNLGAVWLEGRNCVRAALVWVVSSDRLLGAQARCATALRCRGARPHIPARMSLTR